MRRATDETDVCSLCLLIHPFSAIAPCWDLRWRLMRVKPISKIRTLPCAATTRSCSNATSPNEVDNGNGVASSTFFRRSSLNRTWYEVCSTDLRLSPAQLYATYDSALPDWGVGMPPINVTAQAKDAFGSPLTSDLSRFLGAVMALSVTVPCTLNNVSTVYAAITDDGRAAFPNLLFHGNCFAWHVTVVSPKYRP